MNRRAELTNLGGAGPVVGCAPLCRGRVPGIGFDAPGRRLVKSEEHTSELQSRQYLVCRLLLEKKKKTEKKPITPTYTTKPPHTAAKESETDLGLAQHDI